MSAPAAATRASASAGPAPAGSVSCAWTRVALEVAETLGIAEGLAESAAAAGGTTSGDLRDARRRIGWTPFLAFVGSIRRAAPGRNELMRFGASMGGGRTRSRWLGWLVGPGLIYRLALRRAWPRLMRGARCDVNRPGPGRLACEIRVPATAFGGGNGDADDDAAEAFLWITAGQLRTVASGVVGGPPARVDTTLAPDRRSARFEIHLPESRTLAARASRVLRIVFASRRVADTLIGQHGELSQARLERDELHAEFEELMENAPDGILVHDAGRILYANPALARSLGVADRDRLIGEPIDAFVGFDDGAAFLSLVGAGDESRSAAVSLRGRRLTAGDVSGAPGGDDGSVFFDLACSKPIRYAGQRAQLVMIKDVTERHRLERQLMEASDGERRRLAMDLHDGLGQLLSGIAFRAETLRQCLHGDDAEVGGLSRDLVRLSKQAMQQSRALARGLDPVGRFEGGLAVALESLVRLTREIHGVEITLENLLGDHLPIGPEHEIQLYRIAQEAAHNAARHAKASRITLGLAPASGRGEGAGSFELTVRDDGCGFDDAGPRSGLGLEIMKFRAQSIGADLDLDSAPGRGTRIRCRFHPERRGPGEPEGPARDKPSHPRHD